MALRIVSRPEYRQTRNGHRSGDGPYPEYVFNAGMGGGKVFAHGLDELGRVRAIVYMPGPLADMKMAEALAAEKIESDVPEVCRARFSPFNLGALRDA